LAKCRVGKKGGLLYPHPFSIGWWLQPGLKGGSLVPVEATNRD
jgi:hypothetical protein